MRFDPTQFDGMVVLTADNKTGRWAAQVTSKRRKITQQSAGRLPAEASRDTLLAFALTSGLRTIGKSLATRLATDAGVKLPRILVITSNEDFNQAMEARLKRTATEKRLRMGRNFIGLLVKQAARFELSFAVPDESDFTINMLTQWMDRTLANPRMLHDLPPTLAPLAVGTIG